MQADFVNCPVCCEITCHTSIYMGESYLCRLIFISKNVIDNEWCVLPANLSDPMVAVDASTNGKEATGTLLCNLQLLTGSFFSSGQCCCSTLGDH